MGNDPFVLKWTVVFLIVSIIVGYLYYAVKSCMEEDDEELSKIMEGKRLDNNNVGSNDVNSVYNSVLSERRKQRIEASKQHAIKQSWRQQRVDSSK